MDNQLAKIHSIQTLGAVDGPGIRTVVFFQGCPLRCIYCHNPDTWANGNSKAMSVDELMSKILRYKPYFKEHGGVTLSGGEVLMQAEFATELLKSCKQENIHTALDTSGCILNDSVKELLKYTDLVILDIKHANADTFFKITGAKIDATLKFLEYSKKIQIPLWIRQVIVSGINDDEKSIIELVDFIKGANIEKIQLLAYHTEGVYKWHELGINYALENVAPTDNDVVEKLQKLADKLYYNKIG